MFEEIYFNPVHQDYWEKVGDKFRLIGSNHTEDNILGLILLSEEEINKHSMYINRQIDEFIEDEEFNRLLKFIHEGVNTCEEE